MPPGPSNVSISDLVRALPQPLRLRFTSLSGYVTATIEEVLERRGGSVTEDEAQLIQLAALLFSLDEFLRAGTTAARDASTTFVRLGRSGFSVGTTTFTPTSDATLRGEQLADRLRAALEGTRLLEAIARARTMKSLIRQLLGEPPDDEPMGGPAGPTEAAF